MARTVTISIASSSALPFFTTTIFLAFLASPIPSFSLDYTSFVFGGCSQQKFSPSSPYQSNVNSLLTSLLNSASYSSYNNYTVPGSSMGDVVYGLFQCRGDLSLPDCATCVSQAVSRVGTLCSNTCGAAVQLQGCFIKYDNDTFLGVEDKTVVLKKCGPLGGPEPIGQRDSVLAALAGGEGMYRTASGDMFLAKCYVRCSAAGGGGGGSAGTGGVVGTSPINPISQVPPADTGEPSTSDEGEKTFAIIIGLFAGVALIIVFAAFIRKVANGNEAEGPKS
ncbi:hypothetical protein MLD38_024396 [Melastoma candidum]|uniref:Uncharacterized protein n=1 Tax=Melastoma candidum TaxID=119954 RepID=A0ACB9NUV0_9MYRT|nr:hypothetical protein MLD38_024396 [Melastoma candidum]